MAGFEPAFSSTPGWRIARLSNFVGDPRTQRAFFRTSRSCRSRTCQPGFVDPALEIRETTPSTPRQSRTGPPAFGVPALESARQGVVSRQGVRGELNPPPRPSQGRMLACYTTNTIAAEQ